MTLTKKKKKTLRVIVIIAIIALVGTAMAPLLEALLTG